MMRQFNDAREIENAVNDGVPILSVRIRATMTYTTTVPLAPGAGMWRRLITTPLDEMTVVILP